MEKEEKRTIRRLVLYGGIGDDLVFWGLIDTLFLTTVKGLTVAQISGVAFASCLMTVALYFPIRQLIRKVGELNAMRIAALLFLSAALQFTFGMHLLMFALGYFLYNAACSFRVMAFGYVKSYLTSIHQEKEYAGVFAGADRLCSIISLILATVSGLLFNVSPYIPMVICIGFCIAALVLTFTFKDLPHDADAREEQLIPGRRQERLERDTLRCAIIIAAFSVACAIAFSNLKLLYQGRACALFSPEMAVMLFSAVIMANRIAHIVLSFFSARISSWEPFRKRIFQLAPAFVAAALVTAVLGNLVDNAAVSLVLIGVGVVVSNAVLVPMSVVLMEYLLEGGGSSQKALLFSGFLSRVINMVASGCLCLMLGVLPLPQCLAVLAAVLVVLAFIFARWGRGITCKSSKFYYLNWSKTKAVKSGDCAKSMKVLAKHYGVYGHMLVRDSVGEYSFDRMRQAYGEGKPCAVIIDDVEGEAWRPVIYLDDDGFVVLDADMLESTYLKTDPAKMLMTFNIYDKGAISQQMSDLMRKQSSI